MQTLIQNHFASLNWDIEPISLYEPIGYTLSAGGKRIRPQLVLMGAELFGGDIKAALPLATAIEVFHNFTLLHDDIMDNADTRRGRATVHKKWNANTAILSGDAMLIKAYQQLEQVQANKLPELLKLFSQTALEVCEGQQYDMNFEESDVVSLDEYFTMIRLKTAVLLATALKMGAISADANPIDAEHLYQFGINIGIAFQLRDDYLDVYGNEATFGKKIGGDIMCGKKTFLLINALEKGSKSHQQTIKQLLASETIEGKEKVNAITEIYNQLELPALCQEAMERYYNLAMQELQAITTAKTTIEPCVALAQKLMGRND